MCSHTNFNRITGNGVLSRKLTFYQIPEIMNCSVELVLPHCQTELMVLGLFNGLLSSISEEIMTDKIYSLKT